MNGKYFIQVTGNEDQIDKFKKINKNGDAKFYKNTYTFEEIMVLKKFSEDLFAYDASNDNVERLILKGKLTVPGQNREHSETELCGWWKKYLDCPKYPKWSNIIEEVIDLSN